MYTSAERLIIKPHERREILPDYPNSVIVCHHPDYLKIADELTHDSIDFVRDASWQNQTHYRQKYLYKGIPFVIDDARDSARGAIRHTERHYMWGAGLIINIGAAGGIDAGLEIGSVVAGDRAIRDNGIDWDLATPDEKALSDKTVNDALLSAISDKRQSDQLIERGDIWTVSHKYYTWDRLRSHQGGGVYNPIAIDMEMAPFCIMAGWLNANYSQNRGILRIGNMFYISDLLPKNEKKPWVDTVNDVERLIPFKRSVLRWTIDAIASLQKEM
jgi:purine-nucleoside phosphorylase